MIRVPAEGDGNERASCGLPTVGVTFAICCWVGLCEFVSRLSKFAGGLGGLCCDDESLLAEFILSPEGLSTP